MSTLTTRPMSLLHVDFEELYARHLCRHSQFGINVIHLAALIGVWEGVYGIVYSLIHIEWLPMGLAAAYLMLVALNAPARVCIATAAFLGAFVTALLWLPGLPIWAYLLIILACYKIQAWSHKLFAIAHDMTEFNRKYSKGLILFVVLLIYEVPLALNYLLFDKKNWSA
jgi:hypothetical protein